MNEPILKFYSSRMCTITVHQDHFNDKAVEEVASSINLAEKIDPRYGKTKSEISEKPSLPSRKKKAASKNLSEFSDEELYAELQRREEERKAAEELARKKALIEEFLTAYNLTIDDLLQVAEVIWLSIFSDVLITAWSRSTNTSLTVRQQNDFVSTSLPKFGVNIQRISIKYLK